MKFFLFAFMSAGLLSSCSDQTRDERPPNLVLIVVDTLRADRVLGGYDRETAPELAALGAAGTVFERAYSTAPWTMPSVASMLSGLFPETHGVTTPGRMLPLQVDSLPERLLARGYATSAVVSHKLVGTRFQFEQGFERFDEEEAQGHRHISTPGVTARAIAELERLAAQERPFFLFVHYFDPHAKYRRHKAVGFSGEAKQVGRISLSDSVHKLRDMQDLAPDEVAFLRDRYDEEVRFTDAGIGELLAALEQRGLDGATLVALTADHGEEFWDHAGLGHTRTLYDELVHVPLILRGPGVARGRRISEPISLVQLAPTLLDLLGLSAANYGMAATSLASAVGPSGAVAQAAVFAEVTYYGGADNTKNTRQRAVVQGGYKLILDEVADVCELYDLARDPSESRDLAPEEPERVAQLRALIESHVRATQASALQADTELSPQERLDLEALGYGGGD